MAKQQVLQLGRNNVGYAISDNCYRISAKSGVIAAALPAESILFSMRPGVPPIPTYPAVVAIQKIRIQYTTITAFAVPVTAGRSLAIGPSQSGGDPTGGITIDEPFNKGTSFKSSLFDSGGTGHIVIANTAALAAVSLQAGEPRFLELSLSAFGAAGATVDKTWEFSCNAADPLVIGNNTGGDYANYAQLVLYNPAAMDAAGTFEIVVEVDVCELPNTFPYA